MLFKEIIRMALSSLGAHKLRSFLTMAGITIGVFSVIGVMTAVSALRESIETGLSFLGASTVQFSKSSAIQRGGGDSAKYGKRKNITLSQAQRYVKLMEGVTDDISLKAFSQFVFHIPPMYRKTIDNPTGLESARGYILPLWL